MKKIGVDELHRYAFVPQCCDNQFVPNRLLYTFDPDSKKDREDRYKETRGELIRSMIYSSQVLVNRIAFFNNNVFLDFYKDKHEKKALVGLFNEHRMIPIMYKEQEFSRKEITEKNRFTMNDEIEKFFGFLDHEVKDSDLWYSIISEDDDVMARIRGFLSPFFGALNDVSGKEVTEIVKEISPKKANDARYIEALKNHMWKIADEYVKLSRKAKEEGESFDREQFYEQWIIKENTKPVQMYIDRNKDFAEETKKLIDLAYNYNLSAAYNRYFFCPEGMPTPLVIPASLRSAGSTLKNASEYKKAAQREELIYGSQRTYSVPDAKRLTVGQVVMIQSTREWQDFIAFQRELFDDPTSWNSDKVEQYAKVLEELYIRIKTDCRDIPLLENVYLGIRIVIKFSAYLTEYIDMGDAKQIVRALDQILDQMERVHDDIITAFIKVKHQFLSEEKRVIEEFTNGLSDIKLSYDEIVEMRNNFTGLDLNPKPDNEGVAQK
jgi:hypothetical protein